MTATLTDDFVFEYFSQLNPIAYKIQAEINQAIENYEHYWNDLDKREQMTIINEAIIKPEIQLNYHRSKEVIEPNYPYHDLDASLLNYFRPKLSDSDPTPPFSYKTRSQQNLFYSFAAGDDAQAVLNSAVRLPVAKAKNQAMNKSTDSLNCVNLVSLNVKAAKKGRAPGIPTKMTTKPPPPPPPSSKVKKAVAAAAAAAAAESVAPNKPKVPEEPPESPLKEIPKIPEDNNSNTSLLSPADVEEDQEVIVSSLGATTEPSDNDDEFKSLLETSKGFDFLNNW